MTRDVTGCEDCPLAGGDESMCMHPGAPDDARLYVRDDPNFPWGTRAPVWCPLPGEPLTLRRPARRQDTRPMGSRDGPPIPSSACAGCGVPLDLGQTACARCNTAGGKP